MAKPTLLDRAISYVAPRAAARRLMARQTMAALSGGYLGARRDRAPTADWRLPAGSPETDVIADLQTLRERCADLERNTPVGAAVVNTNVEHIVGTGLACIPQINAGFLRLSEERAAQWQADTRTRWRAWAESADCDLERKLNFYGLQDLALRGVLSRGDAFALTPLVQRNGRPRLAVQLLEADRVCNPHRRGNTATLTDGIEHDPITGEPVKVHVTNHHPGDLRAGSLTWAEVPVRGEKTGRRNVLHIHRPERIGLRRGVPVLAPVIETIRQVTRYTEAELQAAVVSSLFAVFLRMDPGAFEDIFTDQSRDQYMARANRWSGQIESGQAINLLPGEEPVQFSPGRPNEQFDPFLSACFGQIGMAVGMPKEVLTMHFQASYSAAKGALMMAQRLWLNRRTWLASALCQPVYELWLAQEVADGRISAPGFFADEVVRAAWCGAQWVGDGFASLDPLKDANAAEKRLELGITTRQSESLAYDGGDWETKHAQQVREERARRTAGLGQPPASPAARRTTPPMDGRDTEDDSRDTPDQEDAA